MPVGCDIGCGIGCGIGAAGIACGIGAGAGICGSPAGFFFLNGQKPPPFFADCCFGTFTGVSR